MRKLVGLLAAAVVAGGMTVSAPARAYYNGWGYGGAAVGGFAAGALLGAAIAGPGYAYPA